jgi:SHS2 domain-containing protein
MYRFLDHPSEALIEVTGPTVEDVFRDSAVALFEIMTDTSKVQPEKVFDLRLEADNREDLLIDWLNKLILVQETQKVFLAQFEVAIHHDSAWLLTAQIKGSLIEGVRERRSEVKSATYGQFLWEETPEGHRVQFVLDV